jgi:hypothetical protein
MLRASTTEDPSVVDASGRPGRMARRNPARGGATADAFGRVTSLLARVVILIVSAVVLVIAAGILLVVLKANPSNGVVSEVHSWAHRLVGPFDGMFSLHSANATIAVNWGIAAVVYLLVGGLIARLLNGRRRQPALEANTNQEGL